MTQAPGFRLEAFGGLTLSRDGQPVTTLGMRRKSLALLAILACNPRGISRDRIALLLWPDTNDENARTVLRQTVYALRKDLNAPTLVDGGIDLRLNPGACSSDVAEFLASVAAGDHEKTVTLYRGAFLDGFHLRDLPDFEDWQAAQRRLFESEARAALEALAVGFEAEGRTGAATARWQRLADLDPLNSRYAAGLVRAMAAAGDVGNALRVARAHESRLRDEVGSPPGPDFTEVVARLRAQAPRAENGTRIIAPAPAASAASADTTIDGQRRGPPTVSPDVTAVRSGSAQRRRLLGFAAVALGTTIAVAVTLVPRPHASAGVATEPTVIIPFRVSTTDSSQLYLRDGMVELLASRLSDDPSLSVTNAASTLSAWRDSTALRATSEADRVRSIADRFGAVRILQGSVVGSPTQLVVSASLTRVDSSQPPIQATVAGSSDSLLVTLDKLAATLLALTHGEASYRVPSITRSPLAAVKAYLRGQAAYRRGDYAGAADLFRIALDADSTFALAGLRLTLAVSLAGTSGTHATRGMTRAWRARETLIPMDRAFLEAFVTGRLPEVPVGPDAETVWERAVAEDPDWPEVWHEYGDILFHQGRGLDHQSTITRTAAALRRALAIDSMFMPVIPHLLQLEAQSGDTAAVRRLGTRYLGRDSTSSTADYVRWRMAHALGTGADVKRLADRIPRYHRSMLRWIILAAAFDGVGVEYAPGAATAMVASGGSDEERIEALYFSHDVALLRGDAPEAVAITHKIDAMRPRTGEGNRLRVLDALYGSGDSAAAANAAMALAKSADAPPATTDELRSLQIKDLCVLAQWELHLGDVDAAEQRVRQLQLGPEPARPADGITRTERVFCGAMLEAMISAKAGRPDLRQLIARFDSTARTAMSADAVPYNHLVRARLAAASGDTIGGLRTVRRRFYFAFNPTYLPAHLREEARLALAVGDTAGATHALRQYLQLRVQPSANVSAELAQVRDELARITVPAPGRRR